MKNLIRAVLIIAAILFAVWLGYHDGNSHGTGSQAASGNS
jgi:hypothetical protein